MLCDDVGDYLGESIKNKSASFKMLSQILKVLDLKCSEMKNTSECIKYTKAIVRKCST